MTPATASLVAFGDTLRLTAAVLDQNGRPMAGAAVAWSSGNGAVATVDASGLVTGVAAGEVEITATSSGVTGSAALTVVDPAPTTVAVAPDTAALTALGQTAQLSAEVRDQAGRAMDGVPVSWSSADTVVAAVDSVGLVTAVGGGTTTVAATAGDASGEAAVTVMQSASSVAVTPSAATVGPGDTLRLVAEAFDENGHAVAGAVFDWMSSDGSVATVTDWGLVRGVSEGTATINATSGDALGTAEVTVENPDRAALVALYDATGGEGWTHDDNWLTGRPLDTWYGVGVDAEGRVTDLRLDFNGLRGPLPPELGDLDRLQSLVLSLNELTGAVPPELGRLPIVVHLDLSNNRFEGEIPPLIGDFGYLDVLDLARNEFEGPIPVALGKLGALRWLDLSDNHLTGPVPSELGGLVNLWHLSLSWNKLEGAIPQSFLQLDNLQHFYNRENEGLCVPGTSAFVAWLEGIENQDGSGTLCNESDWRVLESLFERAGGSGWTNADRWVSGPALDEWHGVRADSLGRVMILDLTGNGLAGQLPLTLGNLAHMTELRISDNPDLSGRLPLSLAGLSLTTLHYAATGLCSPAGTSFRDWLNTVSSHEGTGTECGLLSDREVLEALYEATGGPDWANRRNWLSDAPLGEWHGVEVDGQDRVVYVSLSANGLRGRIPAELGELASLETLDLYRNGLTGPIPPTVADLAELHTLDLGENDLTGAIPPELGSLANLRWLWLNENGLTGRIPSELGNLADLRILDLGANSLTGVIPPELAELASLLSLDFSRNGLSGPVPPELGNLANLRYLTLAANRLTDSIPSRLGELGNLMGLYLGDNDLTGPVPATFGGLTDLRDLAVQTNAGMVGPLPASLTNLATLETLQTGGTDLCAPPDADFRQWLEGVPNRRVALCDGEPGVAYLVQAVQSREFPVPLIAGEEALLRVFPTANQASGEGIPAVRARFFVDGEETHVESIPSKSDPIPTGIDESSLSASVNAVIPATVIRPGLEMVIDVDPEGTVDPDLGVAKRIPDTGRLAVDVRDMPLFDVTVIPFLWTEEPDSSIIEIAADLEADPEGHESLAPTRRLLPVGGLAVRAHEPVWTSSNHAYELFAQTSVIQVMEGGTGYYWGTLSGGWNGPAIGGNHQIVSPADPRYAYVIAHEFGHAMSLPHAPCGGAGNPDPAYPTPDGTIGVWGYDFATGRLVPPTAEDIMGYCDNEGIADYFFAKALHFRLANNGAAAMGARPSRALLLWGGSNTDGEPHLSPAFVVDAPPALPDSAGEYTITGHSAAGVQLFSLSFAMPETADGDGSSGFVFALPVRPGWAGDLASIRLAGPGGSFTLDGDSDLPMTILRDVRTGRIRGFLREEPAAAMAAAASADGQPGVETLFSRGIPSAAAWRR
ncbi:Ig-like domain-containing protein [Candidatus Palauibacter soopunensis]|uniref:Ig-like domain-containing protein n=1 Tax=Candidatus Palauibacter soopunensis TaxID=3056739 RepID=UPI0023835B87|nr:Ig-like domain-containing protein [Candidatus Palauibacter soopunensis]MDE2878622.1 Ig-like domain-containing protein [Candidatus Palauibacter soopunensis]